jgi:hypothetical protein
MVVELAVMAGLSAAQSASGFIAAGRSRKKARRAARKRAALLRRDADVERERGRRLVSEQRAGYGAAGVNPNVGSAADVQLQTLQDSFLRQEQILSGAALSQDEGYLQADLARTEGFGMGISALTQALGYAYDFRRA